MLLLLHRIFSAVHLHCSPDVSRTQCNPGPRTEHTNHASVQQRLRNSALTTSDRKYPVNSKFMIFDRHTKMIRFS